jgi:hypothetical protein
VKSGLQRVCVLAGAGLIGWTDAHTDEIPVVLGFSLILSAILAVVFPRRAWLTGLLMGAPPFVVETLAHFGAIHVPYRPSAGIPWAALLGFVPAMGGALFGSAVRHLDQKDNHAG